MSSTSRTERFQRATERQAEQSKPGGTRDSPVAEDEVVRFSPDEEASLVAEADAHKATANALFAEASFNEAIDTYGLALATCPSYLEYQVAVLHSNIAASYIKLENWKEAVKSASVALDGLDKLKHGEHEITDEGREKVGEEADEEIVSEGAAKAEDVSVKGRREADVEKLRVKVLLRRAKARSEQGGWSSLQGAEEDYKALSQMSNLSAVDRKLVQKQLSVLPPRTKAAQEKETGEMMGKLKELGNGFLKPFGLSTDNFNMVKDEKTGGYSMNFSQGT